MTPRRIGSFGTTAAVRSPLAQMTAPNTARKAAHSPALSDAMARRTVARSRSTNTGRRTSAATTSATTLSPSRSRVFRMWPCRNGCASAAATSRSCASVMGRGHAKWAPVRHGGYPRLARDAVIGSAPWVHS